MVNSHNCESLLLAEAWIENRDDNHILNINQIATEDDLEKNHHLEEVGQTIFQVAINIKFCPYCGEDLKHPKNEIVPEFKLYDFSKW
jgi:NADH pyrophosphatase NudC (nudix superfamily)